LKRVLTTLLYPLLRKVTPRLVAHSQLVQIDADSWRSLGDDPAFFLRSPLLKVLTGWISIKVKMNAAIPLEPKVYLDYGDGFSETRTVTLYQSGVDLYEAELVLPRAIRAMRFDPAENACEFSVENVTITAHSDLLHILHQFYYIAGHDRDAGRERLRIVKKSYARYRRHGLNGMLERLDNEYKRAHPYGVQRATSQHIAYMNWIRRNEEEVHEPLSPLEYPYRPLISVIMPTYNSSPEFLKKAIDSVIGQSYDNWELCIADDASSNTQTLHLLNEYRDRHENVFVYFRSHNGHISKATNTALALARGEYVAFLDHDDMLAPHALKEVVRVLNSNPGLKLVYSDEDKIDEKDNRMEPNFKPGWNPEMFFSQNYISHLSVLKKEVVDKIGGLREGYEGAQDYDLLLRALREIGEGEIAHIEKVLYHWRAAEGSTALCPEQKEYTTEAGVKALRDFFQESERITDVERGLLPNTYKVSYPLPEEQPLVSLLIPTRDGYDILHKCVESILEKTRYENYEIIILDNQTTDPATLAYFEHLKRGHENITVLAYDKPFNYAAINNFGVRHARGEIIGLINNDVEVISQEWLTEMVQYALIPEIGAVGAKLYYSNDTVQHAGVILGIGGVAGHSHKHFPKESHGYFSRLKIVQNLSAVTGACLLLRKELFEEVGGLDEEHLAVAFNDVDLCLKIRAKGYRNLWTPYAELYHHESISRGAEDSEEKQARFQSEVLFMKDKWGGMLENDIYYNPNLTNQHENFGLKIP